MKTSTKTKTREIKNTIVCRSFGQLQVVVPLTSRCMRGEVIKVGSSRYVLVQSVSTSTYTDGSRSETWLVRLV